MVSKFQDQGDHPFVDDIILYFEGTKCNIDRIRSILDFFVLHPGRKSIGEIFCHLGQQKKVGLGMGSRGRVEVAPSERKGSLLGHLSWISTPREGKL